MHRLSSYILLIFIGLSTCFVESHASAASPKDGAALNAPAATLNANAAALDAHSGALDATSAALDSFPDRNVFTVATWNVEYLGGDNGPTNNQVQISNVVNVLRRLQPDLVALQEVSSESALQEIVQSLQGYDYTLAKYITYDQKLAYIYNMDAIEGITAEPLTPEMAGNTDFTFNSVNRLPYVLTFTLLKGGYNKQVTTINLHAKANTGSDSEKQASYRRRQLAAEGIYRAMNTEGWERVIVLGDFNDDLDISIFNTLPTPYTDFVTDSARIDPFTLRLSHQKKTSYPTFGEMIDHIVGTVSMTPFVNEKGASQAIRVHQADQYISNFRNNTSDHLPVVASFTMAGLGTSTDDEGDDVERESLLDASGQPVDFRLDAAYPNPFNPSTQIRFSVARPMRVNLAVSDLTGRRTLTLADGVYPIGAHQVTFNADGLPSGIYQVVLRTETSIESQAVTLIR